MKKYQEILAAKCCPGGKKLQWVMRKYLWRNYCKFKPWLSYLKRISNSNGDLMAQFSSKMNIFSWIVLLWIPSPTSTPHRTKAVTSVFLPCFVKHEMEGQGKVHLGDGSHDKCTLVTSWKTGCHLHVLGLQWGIVPSTGSALDSLPQQATYSPGWPAHHSFSPAPQPICVCS